ncbi:MAG: hypothetical protein M9954_01680 [Cyclobacteriaceae bacterium]|nr:hypothetical protein [Cyclobacteriaceae bacterium]
MKHGRKREDRLYQHLYKDLRHGRRRRKRGNYHDNRGCIANRVSIEKRLSLWKSVNGSVMWKWT